MQITIRRPRMSDLRRHAVPVVATLVATLAVAGGAYADHRSDVATAEGHAAAVAALDREHRAELAEVRREGAEALEEAVDRQKRHDRNVIRRAVRKQKSAARRKAEAARQEGYASGSAAGYSSGSAAGRVAGHAEGYAEGESDGYSEGSDDTYMFCALDDGYWC